MAVNVLLDQLDSLLALSVRIQNPDSLEQTILLARQEKLKLKNKRFSEFRAKKSLQKSNAYLHNGYM